MSKNIRRGVLGALAAAAMTLTLAPMASAAGPAVTAIRGSDNIALSVAVSQAGDWGFEDVEYQWDCKALVDEEDISGDLEDWLDFWQDAPAPEAGLVKWFEEDFGDEGYEKTGECTSVEVFGESSYLNIIVVRNDEYPDALAVTPWAAITNAPVLVNPSDKLDLRVAAEITRLAALGYDEVEVTMVGGTNALSTAVRTSIEEIVGDNVWRLSGVDRYDTAAQIAWEVAYWLESGIEANVYLTVGNNFPDAMAAGAAAAANNGVVLLTKGESIEGYTWEVLDALWKWDAWEWEVIPVGGPAHRAAIKEEINFDQYFDGKDRYETAALLAAGTWATADWKSAVIVSGRTFADAIVGSAFAANPLNGPLLLAKPEGLPKVTADYLKANVDWLDGIYVLGTPAANSLPAGIKGAVEAVLTY